MEEFQAVYNYIHDIFFTDLNQTIQLYALNEHKPNICKDVMINFANAQSEVLWQFHYVDQNKDVDPEMYNQFIAKSNLRDIFDVTDQDRSLRKPSLKMPRYNKTISIEKFVDKVIEFANDKKDEVER